MKKIIFTAAFASLVSLVQAEPVLTQSCIQDTTQAFSHLHLNFVESTTYAELKILQTESSYTEDLQGFPGGDFDITLPGNITAITLSYVDAETGQAIVAEEAISCSTAIAEVTTPTLPMPSDISLTETETEAPSGLAVVADSVTDDTQLLIPPPADPDKIQLDDTPFVTATKPKRWVAHNKKSKSSESYDFSEEIVD